LQITNKITSSYISSQVGSLYWILAVAC
jgi:hypothetical protein